ncbi:MAG: IS66 family insertion sequence element accessory protein TnpA, partial [Lachnospiraceae bacterium]
NNDIITLKENRNLKGVNIMGRICEIKMQLRHKEWAAMVQECQASGKKVDIWCRENGIKVSTYYKRLNVLRNELIEGSEKQSIVPVSVSSAIADADSTVIPNAVKARSSNKDKIIMRKDGIEIELPQSISEDTILVLLRGLRQC